MWPDKPLDFVILNNDNEALHYGLLKGINIISVVSVFIDDNSAQFRKFATQISEQGKGYGSILLNHIMTTIPNENDIDKIWCNARVDKTSFYKKFGMKETDKTFVKSGINYVIMEKNIC